MVTIAENSKQGLLMLTPLRCALREDWPDILKIYNEAIASGVATGDAQEVSLEAKEAWFMAHNEAFPLWVKAYHGRIIAWVSLQPFYPDSHVYRYTAALNIYIEKNFQGKKLGQHFLSEAIEMARHLELKTLLALIFSDNQPSLKLFKKCGFKEWGCLHQVAYMQGHAKDLLLLGTPLGESA